MQTLRQTHREINSRPAAVPVELDTGRLDIRQAAMAAGFTVAALFAALVGAWIATITSGMGAWFGGSIFVVSLTFGTTTFYFTISEWSDYRRRLADWHEAALAAYDQQGGIEIQEEINQWELSTSELQHVLIAALVVHQRVQSGEQAYTVRQLQGPLFMPYGESSSRRVGQLSSVNAERMSRTFGELGLVQGRGERRAGAWVPQDTDELVEIITRNWR